MNLGICIQKHVLNFRKKKKRSPNSENVLNGFDTKKKLPIITLKMVYFKL